jgi:2-methylcitrate dehydratase PrpD
VSIIPDVRQTPDGSLHIADSVVRGFAEFATTLDHRDLTARAVRAAKRCLIDALGCALGAQGTDVIVALQSVAAAATSTRPATLIGTTISTTPDLAAFVNGSAIRCLDFNDDYFGTDESNAHGDNGPHPSDNIGAVLAAAQMAGADGSTTLLGTVLAYEVCGQLVDEVVLRSNGWDYTIFHAIASAAAGARLLGLGLDATANAIRMAAVANLSVHESRAGSLSHWILRHDGVHHSVLQRLRCTESSALGEQLEGQLLAEVANRACHHHRGDDRIGDLGMSPAPDRRPRSPCRRQGRAQPRRPTQGR